MQWNDATLTLTTASHTILFNQATGDTYLNDPTQCAGLDAAPIRSTVDQKPQTSGGIIHPSFYDARHITMAGTLFNRTGTVAARTTLESNLLVALDDCLNTDATLTWSGHSLTVRYEIAAVFSGSYLKTYVFGLVAANPTIT